MLPFTALWGSPKYRIIIIPGDFICIAYEHELDCWPVALIRYDGTRQIRNRCYQIPANTFFCCKFQCNGHFTVRRTERDRQSIGACDSNACSHLTECTFHCRFSFPMRLSACASLFGRSADRSCVCFCMSTSAGIDDDTARAIVEKQQQQQQNYSNRIKIVTVPDTRWMCVRLLVLCASMWVCVVGPKVSRGAIVTPPTLTSMHTDTQFSAQRWFN